MRTFRANTQPTAAIKPCLPVAAREPPSGAGWLHEIKHDGFRIIAVRHGARVRLLTRKGIDLARRFQMVAAAVAALPLTSCVIDGEAISCDDNGLAVFDLLRYRRRDQGVTLCAFDLLELDGRDMHREAIEHRKATLAKLLGGAQDGIAFNEHYSGEGAVFYKHACALGCEGIVSKRLGSSYRAGRADCWIKVKNPVAPAVMREAEEVWSR